jgi:hypothetical protein
LCMASVSGLACGTKTEAEVTPISDPEQMRQEAMLQ